MRGLLGLQLQRIQRVEHGIELGDCELRLVPPPVPRVDAVRLAPREPASDQQLLCAHLRAPRERGREQQHAAPRLRTVANAQSNSANVEAPAQRALGGRNRLHPTLKKKKKDAELSLKMVFHLPLVLVQRKQV